MRGGGNLISEVIALRLPASQLLYQHQFQYGGIFHRMFPASNCPLLTPLPLQDFINYPVTSCIYKFNTPLRASVYLDLSIHNARLFKSAITIFKINSDKQNISNFNKI